MRNAPLTGPYPGDGTVAFFAWYMYATQSTTAVGTATLAFSNCSAATLAYNFTSAANAGPAGTISLSRVGSVPAGCVVA
jgi:hypothetical protein